MSRSPDLDQRVHGARDAPVPLVVQHDAVHLLAVAVEHVQCLARAYPPYAHRTVVASRHERVGVGRYGADRVGVAREDADEVGALGVVSGRARLYVPPRACLGQPPHAQLAVPGPRDDQRLGRHHDGLAILH